MEMFEMFSIALDNGILAALFVGLLVYTLKDSKRREKKYQDIIDELAKDLKVVKEIHQDVTDIKNSMEKKKDK